MAEARPFATWIIQTPIHTYSWFPESRTPELLWRNLALLAEVPDVGRALFTGSLSARNKYWREMASFIRIAKAYDEAARPVERAPSALLHYYAALNLAKAELLVSVSSQVFGARLGHGLSFSPTKAQSIAGDTLRVQPGVFPLLYEKRVGSPLPIGTVLPVPRLLLQCSEVGWEAGVAGLGTSRPIPVAHAWVFDGRAAWSVFLTPPDSFLNRSDITGRQFLRHYEKVEKPSNWRDLFAVSRRAGFPLTQMFQSRRPVPTSRLDAGTVAILQSGLDSQIGAMVGPPEREHFEADLFPGLYRSQSLMMPPDLARYALIFYLSSLVRYKPAAIDPALSPRQSWLADAIAAQSPIFILNAALSGLQGHPQLFRSETKLRN
jgi:hypothetical protein